MGVLPRCCSAREALRQCLPEALTDMSFGAVIRTEEAVQRWLAHLLKNLADKTPLPAPPAVSSEVGQRAGAPQNPFAMQPNNTWSH